MNLRGRKGAGEAQEESDNRKKQCGNDINVDHMHEIH